MGAKVVSKGIKAGGTYIKSKLTKDDKETAISESTMAKIKLASETSGAVFTFAKGAVSGLTKMAGSIANEMVNSFEKSETGQKYVKK